MVYPTSSAAALTLSMGMGIAGSVNTEHADFINAFTPAPLARDVAACIVAQVRCGPVAGRDATPLALRPPPDVTGRTPAVCARTRGPVTRPAAMS